MWFLRSCLWISIAYCSAGVWSDVLLKTLVPVRSVCCFLLLDMCAAWGMLSTGPCLSLAVLEQVQSSACIGFPNSRLNVIPGGCSTAVSSLVASVRLPVALLSCLLLSVSWSLQYPLNCSPLMSSFLSIMLLGVTFFKLCSMSSQSPQVEQRNFSSLWATLPHWVDSLHYGQTRVSPRMTHIHGLPASSGPGDSSRSPQLAPLCIEALLHNWAGVGTGAGEITAQYLSLLQGFFSRCAGLGWEREPGLFSCTCVE